LNNFPFAAIAMPALTGQTLIDVKRIVCPDPEAEKKSSPTLVVAYELEDLVFSQQRFRGHLVVQGSILRNSHFGRKAFWTNFRTLNLDKSPSKKFRFLMHKLNHLSMYYVRL
jgi:hypothetical protein